MDYILRQSWSYDEKIFFCFIQFLEKYSTLCICDLQLNIFINKTTSHCAFLIFLSVFWIQGPEKGLDNSQSPSSWLVEKTTIFHPCLSWQVNLHPMFPIQFCIQINKNVIQFNPTSVYNFIKSINYLTSIFVKCNVRSPQDCFSSESNRSYQLGLNGLHLLQFRCAWLNWK